MKVMLKTMIGIVGLLLSIPSANAQWTGCGIGAGGSMLFGEISNGGPVGYGASGEKAGLTVNCDYRMQAFVLGGEVNYDWTFGDLNTLKVNNELSVLARLGVLTNNSNLLYGAIGWGQLDTSAVGRVNSWKIALGDEFRIPNSPMYADLRVTYTRYNEDDIGISGAKVESLEGGIRLKLKFGPGMFGNKGDLFMVEEPAPPKCDGNVKKNC